ncbi:MAG: hypothetical protein NT088_06060, partial [Candidatus Omnitrophica bacterium]|nr:hypothetical protein [Candidatus Omnitrophota bacterium]
SCKSIRKKSAPTPSFSAAGISIPAPARTNNPAVNKAADAVISWDRCPFSGKSYSAAEGRQDLTLSGIMWSPKNPLAVINDRIVKAGDKILGSVVIEIDKEKVILNNGSADFELKLGK